MTLKDTVKLQWHLPFAKQEEPAKGFRCKSCLTYDTSNIKNAVDCKVLAGS